MWRSILFFLLFFALGLVAALISWMHWNWKTALDAFAVFFCLGIVAAFANLFTIRKLSIIDVFLPIPFAIMWSIVLIPFNFSSMFFSAGAFIGSAFMLSISLLLLREKNMSRKWIVFPSIVYLYEMLPISIPGPFDDIFAFGGTSACVFFQIISSRLFSFTKPLPDGNNAQAVGEDSKLQVVEAELLDNESKAR